MNCIDMQLRIHIRPGDWPNRGTVVAVSIVRTRCSIPHIRLLGSVRSEKWNEQPGEENIMNLSWFRGLCSCEVMVIGVVGLIMTLSTPGNCSAQEGYEFEMKVISGVPVGEFGKHIGQNLWGGSFVGSYHFRETPFALGAHLGFTGYGSESRKDILGHLSGGSENPNYSYKMLFTHLVLRYEPIQSRATPYLEALIGLRYFFTESRIDRGGGTPILIGDWFMVIDNDETATLMESLAMSYGLGGGLKLCVAEIGKNRKSNKYPVSLFLNLQTRYLLGGRARYLRRGAIDIQNEQLILDIHRSRTDLLLFSIGLSMQG